MIRRTFVMRLKPGSLAEYKRRHDEIWPELVEAMREAGFRNYTLFRRGTQVIAYSECYPDAATVNAKIAATEPDQRWNKWFEDIIVAMTDENGKLFQYEEVWHQD